MKHLFCVVLFVAISTGCARNPYHEAKKNLTEHDAVDLIHIQQVRWVFIDGNIECFYSDSTAAICDNYFEAREREISECADRSRSKHDFSPPAQSVHIAMMQIIECMHEKGWRPVVSESILMM